MKNMTKIALMALLSGTMGLATGGCDSTGPSHSAQFTQPGQKVEVGGTVVFREGQNSSATGSGFYGILADNGGQYEPVNLDTRYRADGERINFTGTLDTTQLGEHRWGNPIELASVSAEK